MSFRPTITIQQRPLLHCMPHRQQPLFALAALLGELVSATIAELNLNLRPNFVFNAFHVDSVLFGVVAMTLYNENCSTQMQCRHIKNKQHIPTYACNVHMCGFDFPSAPMPLHASTPTCVEATLILHTKQTLVAIQIEKAEHATWLVCTPNSEDLVQKNNTISARGQ